MAEEGKAECVLSYVWRKVISFGRRCRSPWEILILNVFEKNFSWSRTESVSWASAVVLPEVVERSTSGILTVSEDNHKMCHVKYVFDCTADIDRYIDIKEHE